MSRSERVSGTVGTAKSLAGLTSELVVNGLKISGRNHYVGIENDDIFATRTLHAIVAALAGSAVRLTEIVKIEFSHMARTDIMTGHLRAVLNDDDFKSTKRLACQAVQQLVDLIGTVEDRNDKRIFQRLLHSNRILQDADHAP